MITALHTACTMRAVGYHRLSLFSPLASCSGHDGCSSLLHLRLDKSSLPVMTLAPKSSTISEFPTHTQPWRAVVGHNVHDVLWPDSRGASGACCSSDGAPAAPAQPVSLTSRGVTAQQGGAQSRHIDKLFHCCLPVNHFNPQQHHRIRYLYTNSSTSTLSYLKP